MFNMNKDKRLDKLKGLLHGGDYNPDQWLEVPEILQEDVRLMKLAHVNTVSVDIFGWSAIEPEEGKYTFEWLDELMERMEKNNINVILATPSGAKPAWMSQKYSEILRVNRDRTKNLHGQRHNHCYTSPVYREKTLKINRMLAERYKDNKSLIMWHVSNEFGGECHCEKCQAAFRDFLRKKYDNDINKLNSQWWTGFWSHRFNDFDQIESPSELGEMFVHGLNLDWKRFVTYQTIDFFLSSMQSLAHGADSILYFQWRKGRGASEKFHGAVVDHEGSENSRVFKEVTEVGIALEKLKDIQNSKKDSKVAIIYDIENRWAIDDLQGLKTFNDGEGTDKKGYEELCQE